jgi:protein TonB
MIPSIDLIEPRRRRLIRWLGAATLISAIHIGGGSYAMFYWIEELIEEASGAIVVEIAPVATALATDPLDLPPGPLAEEGKTTPASSDPKIEKTEQETPTETLPSPAPEPEVVLQKPMTVEEKPKDEPVLEPSPLVLSSEQQVAASKTTAPTRIQGEIADKAVAPEAGTSTADRRSILSWQNAIVLHLNRNKRYPAAARAQDIQGDVHVRFVIDRSGQLTAVTIVRSSGHPLLDEEALAMLKRASPLPRPPPAVAGELHELVVPIRFRIQ